MHHPDLTSGVLAGLAWYYLLAAMMNAAAAAYVAYGEMVSEGASRVGLAPKTRRTAGLAHHRLFRPVRPGRPDDPGAARSCRGGVEAAYVLCAMANALLAVMAGADAAHFAEMKAHGHGEGIPSIPPASMTTSPPSGSASPSIARSGR